MSLVDCEERVTSLFLQFKLAIRTKEMRISPYKNVIEVSLGDDIDGISSESNGETL